MIQGKIFLLIFCFAPLCLKHFGYHNSNCAEIKILQTTQIASLPTSTDISMK